jgi:hypothetical protein
MFCPKCHAEFAPGVKDCIDCHVMLVKSLPGGRSAGRHPDDHLVTVFSTHDPGAAAFAESLLASADIRFSVRGMVLPYPGSLPVDLQVLSCDADEARDILADLWNTGSQP